MLFNTAQFVVFLLIVALVHALAPRSWRNAWLLGASLVFYALWIPIYLLLFLTVLLVNYVFAAMIARGESPRRYLTLSIVFTLGVLGYFKYRIFFVDSLFWLTGTPSEPSELFLPLGISFYSFVMIGLNVDIYRRSLELPVLSRYALFVTFFPHLIAGPILRGSEFLSQLELHGVYTSERIRRGMWLLASGLFKKIVLGDFLLAPFVNLIFEHPGVAGAPEHLIAIYSLAFQIYYDFSGYTDMARGMSCLLGYELPLNFAQPYLSRNPAEFWRRWHMTLSRWLRDYLYIPLGGNQRGAARTYLNLWVTMLLGGLWHGASWNFLIWGGLHGALLMIHRFYRQVRGEGRQAGLAASAVATLLTFHAVSALWVFFRAPEFSSAMTILASAIRQPWTGEVPVQQILIVAFCFVAHVLERFVVDRSDEIVRETRGSWAFAGLEGLTFGAVLALAVLCNGTGVSFIYFQF